MIRLPPVETDKPIDDQEEKAAPVPTAPTKPSKTDDNLSKGKGSFATHSFTLKKTK